MFKPPNGWTGPNSSRHVRSPVIPKLRQSRISQKVDQLQNEKKQVTSTKELLSQTASCHSILSEEEMSDKQFQNRKKTLRVNIVLRTPKSLVVLHSLCLRGISSIGKNTGSYLNDRHTGFLPPSYVLEEGFANPRRFCLTCWPSSTFSFVLQFFEVKIEIPIVVVFFWRSSEETLDGLPEFLKTRF